MYPTCLQVELSIGLNCSQIKYSSIGLGEWKSTWLDPCITFIPVTMAPLCYKPAGKPQRWLGKEADWYPKNGADLASLLLKFFSAEFLVVWWAFAEDMLIFTASCIFIFPIQSSHTPLPQISLLPVLQLSSV